MATPVGTPPNMYFFKAYKEAFPDLNDLNFLKWASIGFPLSALFLVATFFVLRFYYLRKKVTITNLGKHHFKNNYTTLGKFSYEEKWIADFWSDDCAAKTFSPAGRWIAVANQVVDHENVDLGTAVLTYAKVGMAIADAGIAAWHEKYRFNYQRPIDYIRQVMGDNNWNSIMCPDGSEFYTPPFPAYPSGHATFGGAAAEALSSIFGYSYSMTDNCHLGRTDFISTPRTFNTFYEMAEESAFSRIPIGVHFRMDSEQGLLLGYRAGRAVNRLPWKR